MSIPKKTKSCPLCGEEILDVAKKCKHCGSMLDGSEQEQNVVIKGADPFAEYYTPIKGKSKGKITFIGYLGIALGILFFIGGFAMLGESGNGGGAITIGLFFIIANYLWARR